MADTEVRLPRVPLAVTFLIIQLQLQIKVPITFKVNIKFDTICIHFKPSSLLKLHLSSTLQHNANKFPDLLK